MAGQIIKRGDRVWLVRVFAGRDTNGRRSYHNRTVHGTKKDADAVMRDMLTQKDRGGLSPRPVGTVNEYLDSWLKTTVAPRRRARTLSDYTDTLERYVRPHLGKLPLSRVTYAEVRGMVAKLQKQGLSARTVRKAHEVTRNALEQAVTDGLLMWNPARGKAISTVLPPKVDTERETVPMAKVQKFIQATKDERLGAYWLVLLFGGLRPSEALGLQWDDIQGDTISIQRTLVDKVGGLHFAPTKTKKSRRAVVVPGVVVDALKAHKKRQAAEQLKAGEAWRGEGLVFCNQVGGPIRQSQTRKSFKALRKASELPDMRIYDLRHSAATLLLEMGEDLKVVSERLGHSTITLTADTYSHVTRGMQERAAAKLNQLVAMG